MHSLYSRNVQILITHEVILEQLVSYKCMIKFRFDFFHAPSMADIYMDNFFPLNLSKMQRVQPAPIESRRCSLPKLLHDGPVIWEGMNPFRTSPKQAVHHQPAHAVNPMQHCDSRAGSTPQAPSLSLATQT